MKRSSKTALFIFLIMAGTWFASPLIADQPDYYQRLKESWQNMQGVFEQVNQHYVEEINPYELVKVGIKAMLAKLDPYTVFIEEDGNRRLKIITTGKYGGLGMEIGSHHNQVVVITPMQNSPAMDAGIMAGDVILKIDSIRTDSMSPDEVSSHLRGIIGQKISLTIQRPGVTKPFEVRMARREIIINDVGFAGFVAPGVAYATLDGFSDKAGIELRQAIKKMQSKGKIKKFILDLRGNPGGLLEAAVDVVNIFVPAGKLVVFTRGYHEKRIEFKTDKSPLLPNVPLAVIVDGGSASASEIVTGALQDMDRAVIVGRSTFGKGLVQKVYKINQATNTRIKITTAKYYIPSGRSIQKRDYAKNSALVHVNNADSLLHNNKHNTYFTFNKREVFDKGGIYPDVKVSGDSLNDVVLQLARNYAFFDFAVDLYHKMKIENVDIKRDNRLFSAFKKWIVGRDLSLSYRGEKDIRNLKKLMASQNHNSAVDTLLANLEKHLESLNRQEFEDSRDAIIRLIRVELAEKEGGRSGREEYNARNSREVHQAISILGNESGYDKILARK